MFSFIGRFAGWLVRHIDTIVTIAQIVGRAVGTLRDEGFWPAPAQRPA